MLHLPRAIYFDMVGHCIAGLPDEGCGLLAGYPEGNEVVVGYHTKNAAASAKLYTVDPKEMLAADRDAESKGLEILGVYHSHTHTDAYPSPTDIDQAPDPSWHYVLISLRDILPVVRSYTIIEGEVTEEPVVVPAEGDPVISR